MEFNIVINQAALRRWVGKINLKDAAIVGFIRNLTSNDPLVRHYMLNGYFRLDAGWILRQLPMLDISEDWVRRCLTKLQKIGLIDCFSSSGRKKRLTTYGRVSLIYLEEEQRVNRALEEAGGRYAEKTPGTGENPRTRGKLPVSENDPGESPIDHKKSKGRTDGTDPPDGVVAIRPEEVPRKLTQEDLDALLFAESPEWAAIRKAQRERERKKQAVSQQRPLPGLEVGNLAPASEPGDFDK
jgi:hypothetical protein